MFIGLFELASTLQAAIPITVADVPTDPSVNPTYRVYDADALIDAGVGSLTQMDTGVITGATNASPIVITDTAHGLQTGNIVKIANVLGNTAANGTFVVTRVTANTFSLQGSTGNGAYTSGGVWHVAGLYLLELSLLAGSGYEVGKTFTVIVSWNVGSSVYTKTVYFGVT